MRCKLNRGGPWRRQARNRSEGGVMLTAGVDLGAQPKRTAAAVVERSHNRAVLVKLHPATGRSGTTDDAIMRMVEAAERTGVDCPLGWPDPFVDFVEQHRSGDVSPNVDSAAREALRFRRTDRQLQGDGHRPLSVSTDRIGVTAMRAAGLLGRLEQEGEPVDRSGVVGKVLGVTRQPRSSAGG